MTLLARLNQALKAASTSPEDLATVELAKKYASAIDECLKLERLSPTQTTALKEAGLTAEQHEALRLALFSARTALEDSGYDKQMNDFIEPASPLAKNIAFMEAHPEEFQAFEDSPMWYTP